MWAPSSCRENEHCGCVKPAGTPSHPTTGSKPLPSTPGVRLRSREEGTSHHYAAAEVVLHTSDALNERIRHTAYGLGLKLIDGRHWTTDAIHRTTFGKVDRYRQLGVNSIDMELSASAGLAHYRQCALSALLVVTDVASRTHTWDGTASAQFEKGVRQAAAIAAQLFSRAHLEQQTNGTVI